MRLIKSMDLCCHALCALAMLRLGGGMAAEQIPAATLVLFRAGDGADEHLFVERAGTMSFAAGAIVFPGGRVDEGDRHLAAHFPDLDPDDAAARVAAIRETIEEAGVAIGFHELPDAATLATMRKQLIEGMVFSDVIAAAGLRLDLSALTCFARWVPKMHQSRNFDTRFYVARLPDGAAAAIVDATENVRLFWGPAQSVLDDADAGRVQIIFPTRRNLERLAKLATFDAALAEIAMIAPEKVTPWIETRGDAQYLRIADDRGYPVTEELLTAAVRG
jgi:8-oxo-dGTP pyrophosphatase MutT (NUDIX family)